MVQNNEWGAEDGQCVTTNSGPGFTVDSGDHNQSDSPAAYPSIMSGCWMGTCTRGTPLPVRIGELGPITSSIAATFPARVKSNLAYDIWADSTPKKTGQNDATELMIWLKETGGIAPIGTKTGTAAIGDAAWDIWKGTNGGVDVISYVRRGYVEHADDLPITDFVRDAVKQGSVKESDYLTNIQAGFEPWSGGPGLQLTKFNVTNGTAPDSDGTSAGSRSPTTTPSRASGPLVGPTSTGSTTSSPTAPTRRSATTAAPSTSRAATPSVPAPPATAPPATLPEEAGGAPGAATPAWSLSSGLAGFQSTPWNNENATDPTAATSPNVPGRQAVKFYVPGGGKRSEAEPENSTFRSGDREFFGYSAYLADDFATDAQSWQVIWQLHDGGTNGSPPVALEIGAGKLWLAASGNDRAKDLGVVQAGENVAVELEVQFAEGGGTVNVWRDGKQVVSGYTPPEGTMVDDADYLKTGIYRDPSEGQPSTLYLNDLKIGDSLASVGDLAGQTGAARTAAPAAGAILVLTPLLGLPVRRRRRRGTGVGSRVPSVSRRPSPLRPGSAEDGRLRTRLWSRVGAGHAAPGALLVPGANPSSCDVAAQAPSASSTCTRQPHSRRPGPFARRTHPPVRSPRSSARLFSRGR